MVSLIETCKLSLVNPKRYLTHVLTALSTVGRNLRIDELMPWH